MEGSATSSVHIGEIEGVGAPDPNVVSPEGIIGGLQTGDLIVIGLAVLFVLLAVLFWFLVVYKSKKKR